MIARGVGFAKARRLARWSGIALLGFSGAVAGTPADPVTPGAVYRGTASSTQSGCASPLDDGIFSGQIELVVSSLDNDSGAVVLSITTSGMEFDSSGSVEGTLFSNNSLSLFNGLLTETDGTITSFSGSGVLDSTSASGTVSGSNNLSCSVSASFSASAVATGLSRTDRVPSSSVLTPQQQLTALRSISRELGRRFTFMRGFVSGDGENRAIGGYADSLSFQKAGLSAGDGAFQWGAWGSVTYTDSEDDFAATASDTTRVAFLGGADFAPWRDDMIFGVALGFEHTDSDTGFNAGEQTVDGITLAPYFAAFLGDHLSTDLSIGYTDLDIDQFRTSAGTRISSDTDSARWFAAANLNYTAAYGAWILGGRGGILFARDRTDAFVESNGTPVAASTFKLGQAQLGIEAGYRWHEAWEPFGSLVYEYDFSKTDLQAQGLNRDEDRAGAVLGLGVRYFGAGGTSGMIQLSTVLGRENIDEYSIGATIRTDF